MNNSFRKKAIIVLTDEDLLSLGVDPEAISDDDFEAWASEVGYELSSLDYYSHILMNHLPAMAGSIRGESEEAIAPEEARALASWQ